MPKNRFEALIGLAKDWIVNPLRSSIENLKFGSVKVVQVVDDQGNKLYEGIIFTEAYGAISITVDMENPQDPRIAILMHDGRHAVIDVQYLDEIWTQGVPDIFDPEVNEHMGTMTINEVPRGFGKGELLVSSAEAEEEAGRRIKRIYSIGHINANTASMATSPLVLVAEATKDKSSVAPDPHERIREVLWIKPEEVKEKLDLCGLSMGSMWKFRTWCLEHEDPKWVKLGERL